MKLTKKEQAWLDRLEKLLSAAPKSLDKKVSSYTVGDADIVLYDRAKYEKHFEENPVPYTDNRDQCSLVSDSDSEIVTFDFPFSIESTAG